MMVLKNVYLNASNDPAIPDRIGCDLRAPHS